ncbi:MAG: flagellar hook assembly protein FlgD [Desulfobacteraceae bacterium]|jgi:flagellar basal-body rod modification protein FlgD
MSDITSIQSSIIAAVNGDTSSTDTTTAKSDLLMEDFLTILLAQYQYQDPLNPMEGSEMTSQLTQISSLEQQYNSNDLLETISSQLSEVQGSDLLGYLGKEVWLEGGIINIQGGNDPKGFYSLEEQGDVEIVIYDREGGEIKRLYLNDVSSGKHDLEWDGTDSTGEKVEDGVYLFEVIATTEDGVSISTSSCGTGIVTGITYKDEEPCLMIGDLFLSPESVLRVCTPTSKDTGNSTTES